MSEAEIAAKAITFIDHTTLNDSDTVDSVTKFVEARLDCKPAPAAFCIFPQFVKAIKPILKEKAPHIKLACVVNFPLGQDGVDKTVKDTTQAVADGADEIDMVIDYKEFREDPVGSKPKVTALVKAVCDAAHAKGVAVKVILETGELKDASQITAACEAVIEAGPEFLKTSTGKVPVNATPESVELLFKAAAKAKEAGKTVGVKVAGGVKTVADAQAYIKMGDDIMGQGWLTPKTFRFGSSGLLPVCLGAIEGKAVAAGAGY